MILFEIFLLHPYYFVPFTKTFLFLSSIKIFVSFVLRFISTLSANKLVFSPL